MTTIKIGSRKSKLAMWQTETVARMLNEHGMETVISSMETKGDKILNVSIAKIGSKGVFTEELEEQLRERRHRYCRAQRQGYAVNAAAGIWSHRLYRQGKGQ